ncbi:MAG: dihydroorotate dehydrogenase [Planctomycetes bacterium]|nr:dihydroorotate dehydrogenase [Planctomycetota bacterium]
MAPDAIRPGEVSLDVRVGRLALKNPVLVASGCGQFGEEISSFADADSLGGVVGKSFSLRPRDGNPPPRTAETPSGMINSIGLENKGLDAFRADIYPRFARLGTLRIASLVGERPEEYRALAEAMAALEGIDAVELNLSCPNVEEGGRTFGKDPRAVERITREVRARFPRPVWTKLTPGVSSMAVLARAAEAGGADAVTVMNTLVGMSVDWARAHSRIGSPTGGVSGPAVKPLALANVWQVASCVGVPVVASGGASCARDVLEFMTVGARAVQVGTAFFMRPTAGSEILAQLPELLAGAGLRSAEEAIGRFRPRHEPPGHADG